MYEILSIHKSRIKIVGTSLLFLGSLFWVLGIIFLNNWWIFGNEPLVVSVLISMSLIVFSASGRVVSIRKYVSLRAIGLFFSVVIAVCVFVWYLLYENSLRGLLRVIACVGVCVVTFVLISTKRQAFDMYRTVSSRRISLAWSWIFAVWTAVIWSLLVSVSMITVPLTCESIYSRYDKIIQSPLVPIQRSEQSLQSLWEQSVFSALRNLQQESEEWWEQLQPSDDDRTWSRRSALTTTFNETKQTLIDETLEQRSLVTQNVCELVLWQIDEIRKTASWNISIVILLFVILSPIITLWFRFVSYGSRAAFKILMLFGLFRNKKRVITSQEIV